MLAFAGKQLLNVFKQFSWCTITSWLPMLVTIYGDALSRVLYGTRLDYIEYRVESSYTVKLKTLALLNFDESWFIEFWRKKCWWIACKCCWIASFKGANFAWWLYFERFKFGDFTLIRQIRQSFHSSKFPVLRYTSTTKPTISINPQTLSSTLTVLMWYKFRSWGL